MGLYGWIVAFCNANEDFSLNRFGHYTERCGEVIRFSGHWEYMDIGLWRFRIDYEWLEEDCYFEYEASDNTLAGPGF